MSVFRSLLMALSQYVVKITPCDLTGDASNPDFTVSQSSTNGTNHAYKAMDGNATISYSHTGSQSCPWWAITFAKPVKVIAATWTNRQYGSSGGDPYALHGEQLIQGSEDGITWQTYATLVTETSAASVSFSTDVNGGFCRYWRIMNPGTGYLIIGELQFKYIEK